MYDDCFIIAWMCIVLLCSLVKTDQFNISVSFISFWIISFLFLQVLVKGTSDVQPQRGEICKINYTGKLENDTIVESFSNVYVQIGDVEVIICRKRETICHAARNRIFYGILWNVLHLNRYFTRILNTRCFSDCGAAAVASAVKPVSQMLLV